MTTREDASALVRRMHECFNSRQFDQAADLHTPGFFSHPLGTPGFEAGKEAWRILVARYPGIRVVAQDILVDGDKAAVRSAVEGSRPRTVTRSPCCSRSSALTMAGSRRCGGPARDFRPQLAPRICSAKLVDSRDLMRVRTG
jgi:hypothetical protein